MLFRAGTVIKTVVQRVPFRISAQIRTFSLVSSRFGARKFSDKHEWIAVAGKIGTIGISQYAQEALGDVVYAQLPDVDASFSQGEEFGTVESVKAASDVYCPASGRVTEKNTAVEADPSLINKSPYEKGWLFKLELSNPGELNKLLDEKAYENYLKTIKEGKE